MPELGRYGIKLKTLMRDYFLALTFYKEIIDTLKVWQ